MRAQMLDPHARQDHKAAVANDTLQFRTTRGVVPAQPLITRADAPGRCAHRQTADHAVALADDQVADLRPAQRTGAQRVMRRHHGVPSRARHASPINGLQGDHSEITQGTAHLRPHRRRGLIRSTPRRLPSRRRQRDLPAPLQGDKPLAASHLLQPPARVPPRESLTHLPCQPIASAPHPR